MPATERGYLHVALAWVHAWDIETRERVLIERAHQLEKKSPLATLPYMVAHNDWRGIVRWIDSLHLGMSKVDAFGQLCLHETACWARCDNHTQSLEAANQQRSLYHRESSSHSSDQYTSNAKLPPLVRKFSELICKVKDVMRFSSAFVRELVTNELAKRGVFLRSDIGLPPPAVAMDFEAGVKVANIDSILVDDIYTLHSAYWTALLRRLSKSNILFRNLTTSGEVSQIKNKNMPNSKRRINFRRGWVKD